MGYFILKSEILLYGACARLIIQHISAQKSSMVHWYSRSSASFIEPGCFGSVWAWPDYYGCTGATRCVGVGVGTGITFGMAEGVETGTADFDSQVMGATDCGVH